MSKKSTAKRIDKKAVSKAPTTPVLAAVYEVELSYDEMLNELEAIVIEADVRLAEEALLA